MFLQAFQPGQTPGNAQKKRTTEATLTTQYKVKRKQLFVDHWRNEFDWIRDEDGEMFCCSCRAQTNLADNNVN